MSTKKIDKQHKKILISDLKTDGSMGINWVPIQGEVIQGNSQLSGTDPGITPVKNVNGKTIATIVVEGDTNYNFQAADISAENRHRLIGGKIVEENDVKQWLEPSEKETIEKSVMIMHSGFSIDWVARMDINAYIVTNDDNVAYLQANNSKLEPENIEQVSSGYYESYNYSEAKILDILVDDDPDATVVFGESAEPKTAIVTTSVAKTAVTLNFETSIGSYADPVGGVEADYTNPKTITVEAADGTKGIYTVSVVNA